MAEEIAISFAQEILKELLLFAASEVSLALSFKDELEKLQKRSNMVAEFLSDAESKPSSSSGVQSWLKRLKCAVNDADAVLDEFKYELLRRKIAVRGRFTKKVTDFFSPSRNPFAFRLKLAHNIRNINSQLDVIYKKAHELGLEQKIIDASEQMALIQSTHPGVDVKNVVGREEDVSKIVRELVGSNSVEDLPVISIVGMAGQGKTTVAQLVYRDATVDEYFDKKIWVCVSEDFNVNRLLNEIAQYLTLSNPQLSSNGAVINLLCPHLDKKRYLLILDDVWNEFPDVWSSMRNALLEVGGLKGSKIVVTTRSQKVAEIMGSSFTHVLSGLLHDESMTLFKRKAFATGGAPETLELVEIGEKIVERCAGVPLVIAVVGSLLCSKKSKDEWLSIRDNSMWGAIGGISSQVDKFLELSYNHLSPLSLKHCFVHSSILPKDSVIDKDSLAEIWMALGLLPSQDDGLDLEDVGANYFNHLLGRSLLQDADTDAYGDIESCKMHDLVHDLAQKASKGYCLTLSGSAHVNNVPDNVTHLTLLSPKKQTLELAQGCYKRLHTLFLEGSLVGVMLEDLKLLRVLVLIDSETEELPSSIGKLKHLRYLDISRTCIRKLPSSITKLYNLQTLKVEDLEEIKGKVGNLVNLRHFYGGGVLKGVGMLTSLLTLSVFVVSRDRGCLIEELGGLIKLKGKLSIHGLSDIRDEEEAKTAKLVDKSRIQALEFKWEANREDGECSMDEAVLEGLRPHCNLKSLKIENFKGVKLARWMTSESFVVLKNLVEIKLEGCDRCKQVPTLGHLPNLKKVEMKGLERVEKIGEEFYHHHHHHEGDVVNQNKELSFPALKELVLDGFHMLEKWVDVKQVNRSSSSSSSWESKAFQFPNLEKLEIQNCFNLMVVPSQFPYLKKLILCFIYNSRLKWQKMCKGLTCLTHLELAYVDCKVERLLEELFKNNSRSLTYVWIQSCDQLVELPESLFKDCSSLKQLLIYCCSNIKAVPDVGGLTSLKDLEIYNCEALNSLPRGIETLTSLQNLTIRNCPAVVMSTVLDLGKLTRLEELNICWFPEEVNEIPRMPTSLRHLWLDTWPNIKQLPYQQLGHLSALNELRLWKMEGLEALPEWLEDLSSLQVLNVSDCSNLKSMPTSEAIRCLRHLEVTGCPVLSERCVKGSGTDWHKIQHIPYIKIEEQVIQDMR